MPAEDLDPFLRCLRLGRVREFRDQFAVGLQGQLGPLFFSQFWPTERRVLAWIASLRSFSMASTSSATLLSTAIAGFAGTLSTAIVGFAGTLSTAIAGFAGGACAGCHFAGSPSAAAGDGRCRRDRGALLLRQVHHEPTDGPNADHQQEEARRDRRHDRGVPLTTLLAARRIGERFAQADQQPDRDADPRGQDGEQASPAMPKRCRSWRVYWLQVVHRYRD